VPQENTRGHKPLNRKITIKMHTVEYTGADPAAPWEVTTDDGVIWYASTELEAGAEFIVRRAGAQPEPELSEGTVLI